MTMRLRVELGNTSSGSLPLTITDNDEHTLTIFTSDVLSDPIYDLMRALIALALPGTVSPTVCLNTEPEEYELHFLNDGNSVRLVVFHYPDTRRQLGTKSEVFCFDGERLEVILVFWRALRNLESRRNACWEWRYPFPEGEMRKLTLYLANMRQ